MRQGELLYFTQAELEVMLDLSGGAAHTLYRTGPPPDDDALTAAFTSLYQRGFLTRQARSLLPAPRGDFFREMGAAPLAVTLSARYPRGSTALCYGGGDTLWLCENVRTVISEQVRLSRIPWEGLESWFFETGILEPPLLAMEDAAELSGLWDGGNAGEVRLCLRKYRNGGALLGVYEVLDGGGLPLIRVREGKRESTELYTVEALRGMLEQCFRKDGQQVL